ncbi:mediator of RNA polymerase II transcription subunit 21 [Xylaria sp. FL0933]|nr:mediator of RNA polymerase II transcription subunit 21 [Xylaria sp. FL1042]KAI0815757.1 mediator of RNA polymerase II transcription subunit 21 [Xylaria sp. FL0064]KAI1276727.1 mediator of RNA polymerase II transcription subunit 21 [Xylaria sp. FL0933]KAI1351350.1 mediator of RNA polymerase II transcription subunit 21 [Xylaria sp. FL0043]
MGDRLTQLQDAVDQLATQFIACINYINQHHSLETLGPRDQIVVIPKQEADQQEVDPHPEDVFRAAQVELAQDLITKEQQIELLISILPGLDNSEQDQERNIRELEEELKVAEAQRQEAIKEREETLAKLDTVIRSIRRP